MAEEGAAERARREADGEHAEDRDETDRRIELGEEQAVEDDRREERVDQEVVPLDRRAEEARQQHAPMFPRHLRVRTLSDCLRGSLHFTPHRTAAHGAFYVFSRIPFKGVGVAMSRKVCDPTILLHRKNQSVTTWLS